MKKLYRILLFLSGLGSLLVAQPCKEAFKPVLHGHMMSRESERPKLAGGGRPQVRGSQGRRRAPKGQSEDGEQSVKKSGLNNLGNTCFMNAALQALYEIEPLREFIIQWGAALYLDPLINDLSALFKKMRNSQKAVIDSETFVQFVWHAKDKSNQLIFRQYRQGDSHEFITFLINRLVNNVKPELQDQVQKFLDIIMSYTYESVYTLPAHWNVSDEPRQEKEKGLFIELPIEQQYPRLDIGRLIDAQFIPQQVELAPRRVLSYFHNVTAASLAVWDAQKKLSFEEFEHLLASYKESIEEWQYHVIRDTLTEIKDTREKYKLFFDKKYDDKKEFETSLQGLMSLLKNAVREVVQKGTRFSKLPPFLSIQLKLFETLLGGKLRKISQHVHTPMLLSLPSVTGSLLYRLKAAVIHAGTVDRGHYYAYTRAGNQWYECNDSMLTPLTEQYTERALQKKTPYLVFYQREDITQEFVSERLKAFERAVVTQIAGESEPEVELAPTGPPQSEPLIQEELSIESEQMVASLEDIASELQEHAQRV